jgi:hypothetical protein
VSEFLVWPVTPEHSGKVQLKRQPFVVICRKYKEIKENFSKDAEKRENK